MNLYAGIGARATPAEILELMTQLARRLADDNWMLRSGGAPGADDAFEHGAGEHRLERYLPFYGHNGHKSARLYSPTPEAYELAERYHPSWYACSRGVRTLHARNGHIVLGPELDTPVRMVVCWTPDGTLDGRGPNSGGTGQALRVAVGEAPAAQIFNLQLPEHRTRVQDFLL